MDGGAFGGTCRTGVQGPTAPGLALATLLPAATAVRLFVAMPGTSSSAPAVPS